MLRELKKQIELKTTGFQKPTDDFAERRLSLSDFFKEKPSVFLVQLQGDAPQLGIFNQDIAVIDKSLSPVNGDVVLATINSEIICGKFLKTNKGIFITSGKSVQPIIIDELADHHLWGVLPFSVRRHRKTNFREE